MWYDWKIDPSNKHKYLFLNLRNRVSKIVNVIILYTHLISCVSVYCESWRSNKKFSFFYTESTFYLMMISNDKMRQMFYFINISQNQSDYRSTRSINKYIYTHVLQKNCFHKKAYQIFVNNNINMLKKGATMTDCCWIVLFISMLIHL